MDEKIKALAELAVHIGQCKVAGCNQCYETVDDCRQGRLPRDAAYQLGVAVVEQAERVAVLEQENKILRTQGENVWEEKEAYASRCIGLIEEVTEYELQHQQIVHACLGRDVEDGLAKQVLELWKSQASLNEIVVEQNKTIELFRRASVDQFNVHNSVPDELSVQDHIDCACKLYNAVSAIVERTSDGSGTH